MKPDRIRAIMRERKLSCREFAILLGINKRTLESYIQERRPMPEAIAERIICLAGILERNPEDKQEIFGGEK